MIEHVPRVRAELEVIDDRFARCRGDDYWDHHFDAGRWTEGPLYVPAGRYQLRQRSDPRPVRSRCDM